MWLGQGHRASNWLRLEPAPANVSLSALSVSTWSLVAALGITDLSSCVFRTKGKDIWLIGGYEYLLTQVLLVDFSLGIPCHTITQFDYHRKRFSEQKNGCLWTDFNHAWFSQPQPCQQCVIHLKKLTMPPKCWLSNQAHPLSWLSLTVPL